MNRRSGWRDVLGRHAGCAAPDEKRDPDVPPRLPPDDLYRWHFHSHSCVLSLASNFACWNRRSRFWSLLESLVQRSRRINVPIGICGGNFLRVTLESRWLYCNIAGPALFTYKPTISAVSSGLNVGRRRDDKSELRSPHWPGQPSSITESSGGNKPFPDVSSALDCDAAEPAPQINSAINRRPDVCQAFFLPCVANHIRTHARQLQDMESLFGGKDQNAIFDWASWGTEANSGHIT